MSNDITNAILCEPFPESKIHKREGAGRKHFDYVSNGDVIERVIQATGNTYCWEVERLEMISDGKNAFWLCLGKLSIEGLGVRSGAGTALAMNEDSIKSAETDAFKRAAVKFGVALELYLKDDEPGMRRDFPQEFAGRCARIKYTGKKSDLCAALVGKERADITASHYAEALKLSAQEWNRAIDSLSAQNDLDRNLVAEAQENVAKLAEKAEAA